MLYERETGDGVRKKLEALVCPQRRLVPYPLELLISLPFRPVRRVVPPSHQKGVHVHDEGDERVVRADGEEDGVVDEVRVVLGAGRGDIERDEVLLQALDRIVDLVEQLPEVTNEAEDGSRTGSPC